MSPSPGQINYAGGDRWVGFAHQNGLKVKVHHLVWHRYFEGHDYLLPSWIIDETGTVHYNKEELSWYLKDFITRMVTHYKTKFPGTVNWWCVVNEAGSNTTGFTKNLWIDSLGVSHIDSAFTWAREAAGADIKLFYNDYFYHGLGWDGARMPLKIDFAYQTVSAMQQRGVHIDGMGFQTHLNTVGYPGKSVIAADMKRFTDLGLEVYITEMDVAIPSPVTQEKLEQQATIYKEIFEIALENPMIKLVCLWQFNDAQSWLGTDREALIMDSQYQPKPAYDSIVKTLINAAGLPTIHESKLSSEEVIRISESGLEVLIDSPHEIMITNLKGQVVNRVYYKRSETLPLRHLQSGVYIVTVRSAVGNWQLKFYRE